MEAAFMVQTARTVGRPALPGPRYDSGRRKPKGDPRGRAIFNRLRDAAIANGTDPRFASGVMLLSLTGELTGRQCEAADTISRIYGAFAAAKRLRRNPAAPGYVNAGTPDDSERSAEDVAEDWERRIQDDDARDNRSAQAVKRWLRLQKMFDELPAGVQAHARSIIEGLCVNGHQVHSSNLHSVRIFLDKVAEEFNIQHDSAAATNPIAITASRPPRPKLDSPRRNRLDREAVMLMAREDKPDATPDELEQHWQRFKAQRAFVQAKQDRDRLARRKGPRRTRT